MSLVRVRDLMSTDLVTLRADQDFRSASETRALKAQAKLMLQLGASTGDEGDERVVSVRVRDFMTTEGLITCQPATPVDDAARLMLERKLGCVLVVDQDELVGIVTEADLVECSVEMMAKTRLESRGGKVQE